MHLLPTSSWRPALAAIALLASAALVPAIALLPTAEPAAVAPAQVSLPVDFVANHGQWPAGTAFVARQGGASASLTPSGITIRGGAGAGTVRLAFAGAASAATLVGEGQRDGTYNFVVGNDPAAWRSGVPSFAAVRYSGLYPGIDVRVRDGGNALEYDALLAPNADLTRFVVAVGGADAIAVAGGDLVITTGEATLRQSAPVAWEVLPTGAKRPVASRFRIIDATHYGFEVIGRDPSLAMVIDPGIDWATYLGGSGDETLGGMARVTDGTGDIVVAGTTRSPEFPATGRITGYDTPFVARLNSAGTALVYATYFGGTQVHTVKDVAVDAAGNPLVVGDTNSKDFPTTAGAIDATPPGDPALPSDFGWYDGYAIRFNASGGGPLLSTYLSGDAASGQTIARRAGYTPTGDPVVAGTTTSAGFPTTAGAFDRVRNAKDIFVSRISPDGTQLRYSTLFGGDGGSDVFDMAIGTDGAVNITGQSFAAAAGGTSMPTTLDAIDRVNTVGTSGTGWHDAFYARLRLNGAGVADLEYATFIGGSEWANEAGNGIALTPGDPTEITLSGFTRAGDFPTTPGALQRTHFAPVDTSMGWVARFRVPGAGQGSLAWSTLFGAPGNQSADDVVVDASGAPIIVGGTSANNPPTTDGAYDRIPEGLSGSSKNGDAYVAKLNALGTAITYSSLIGASAGEAAFEVEHAGGNTVVLGGVTTSTDFPVTTGALDGVYAGDGQTSGNADPGTLAEDIFVARFTLDPQAGDSTAPAAPQISWPQEGAVFTTTSSGITPIAFDWSDVADTSGIAAYHVQVSPNPTFTNDRASESAGWFEPWSPTSFAVRTYCCGLENGTFSMRVQALDQAGNLGPWSAVRTFQITPAATTTLTAPTLTSPPNAGRYGPGSITFGWNHVTGAQGYTLEVDSTTAFNSSNKITQTGLTINRGVVALTTTRTWYWRVRATAGGTAGPWSTTRNVQIRSGSPAAPVPPPGTPVPTASTPGTGLKAVTLPETVFGPSTQAGTVTLHQPAPAGGALVALASQVPARIAVPASVTVPAGATTATFSATVVDGQYLQQIGVSGSYGGSSHGTVMVTYPGTPALQADALTLASTSVAGGNTVQATVRIQTNFTAGPGGAVVHLGSSNPAVATVPASVTIPAGGNNATFPVTTSAVTHATSVFIVASRSVTKRVTLQVLPPATLSGLSVNPNPAIGSGGATGTVTLGSAAPAGGKVVALTSSDTRWATVPASVTVPAGATSATFTIATTADPASGRFSVITATADSIERWVSLSVNPGSAGGGTPGAPALLSPSADARFSPGQTVTFDWADVSGATSYTIEVDDSSTFGAPLVATQTVTASAWSTASLPTRTMWWRVRAVNGSGAGAWSTVRRFEVK